mgnify:CR=1 FL=1
MTTFTPTHDVVTEATAAGFFPPRHNVEITQVTELTDRVMRLTFRDPFIASHAKPAQFVNLFTHDDFMLMPRPFGVSEVDGDEVSVIFAVVGHGTEQLAGLQAGDTVDVLGPLGRGFNLKEDANYILVGGGLGVPPLISPRKSSPNTTPPLPPPYSVTATTTSPRNTSPGTRTGRGASTTPKATWSTCSTNWNKATT